MRIVLGTSDMLAYLVMMAPRLIEMRRVLKSTGVIYLHCDPTAGHYLKLLMDQVFVAKNFRNEIIWYYNSGARKKSDFGKRHDTIFRYSKTDAYFFDDSAVRVPYSPDINIPASKAHYYDPRGKVEDDVWRIPIIPQNDKHERLGYPTQKPIALLDRIIKSSCPQDGVVLDPFCGCGTAVDSAQLQGRRWVGIDITYIAVDLIIKRLQHRYGDEILSTFATNGIPTDIEGAEAFFARNPFDFERWAVSFINGEPNQKQVGDRGIDGRIRFHRGGDVAGLAAVSVKGGHQLNPSMVQALVGAMGDERADMGVLITLQRPTAGMLETASRAGIYEHPPTGNRYQRVQIITVPDLFDGKHPNMPTVILPYIKARPRPQSELVSLFDEPDVAEESAADDEIQTKTRTDSP